MTEILKPHPEYTELTSQVVALCLHEGDVVFANGENANNHLNMAYQEVNPVLRHRIGVCATALILHSGLSLDFIATVPTGADGWGDAIHKRLAHPEIARIKSTKVARRQFANSDISAKVIERLISNNKRHGIVIDDATSDGGTTEAYSDFLTEQGLKVDLAMSLFYRGVLEDLQSKHPRAVLLNRQIPLKIDWSEFKSTSELTKLQ